MFLDRLETRTVASLLESVSCLPISLFTHSVLSPKEELTPGTTRGIMRNRSDLEFCLFVEMMKMLG